MERATPALQKIVVDILHRAPPEEMPMLAWPLVCGAGVANRTRAMDFMGGVLRIEVPDQAWKTQLEALKADYLRAFGTLVIQKKVEQIEFVVPNLRRQEPLGKEK